MKGGSSLWIGGALVALAVVVAISAPWIALTDPVMDANLMNAEIPPGWEFPFGTDMQGRDIYLPHRLRRAHLAHRRHRQPDLQQHHRRVAGPDRRLLGRLVGRSGERPHQPDAGDPLADLRARHHGDPRPRPDSLLIALGLTNWSYSCRLARAQVLSLKSQGYVQAARILGYGDLRIMFTQLLPNILGPLIVIATLGMGGAILAEAALSFLGLGIRPPFPSWGSMLSEARDQITTAPWLSVFPGLAIFLTVLGLNLLGDGLRDILDPQSTTRRA